MSALLPIDEARLRNKAQGDQALAAVFAELDATRARLSEAERDALAWKLTARGASTLVDAHELALASREADCAELAAALTEMTEFAKDHDRVCAVRRGQPACDCGEDELHEGRPAVIRARAALSRPRSGYEALRAWTVTAVREFAKQRMIQTADSEVDEVLARLLPSEPKKEGEG